MFICLFNRVFIGAEAIDESNASDHSAIGAGPGSIRYSQQSKATPCAINARGGQK